MFRLFGGKNPEFTIQLDRADAVYFPGDTVRAVVTLTSAGESKFREISVGLVYQERFQVAEIAREQAGDQRTQTQEWRTEEQWAGKEIIARDGALNANFNQTYNFAWQIPQRVGASYNGEIAQISWMVRATIDRQPAQEITRETPLGVVVPPPNAYVQAGEFIEDNPAHEAVDVRFQLPKLEFVQGEEVRGRVAVSPKESIEPRSIRLDLVRSERVGANDGNSKIFIEGSLALAPKLTLQVGVPVHYDFAFQIPPSWCPSYRTPNSYATWHLALALDLPWKSDATARQSLLIYNGYQIPSPAQATPDATPTNFPLEQPLMEQPISQPLPAPAIPESVTIEPLVASQPPHLPVVPTIEPAHPASSHAPVAMEAQPNPTVIADTEINLPPAAYTQPATPHPQAVFVLPMEDALPYADSLPFPSTPPPEPDNLTRPSQPTPVLPTPPPQQVSATASTPAAPSAHISETAPAILANQSVSQVPLASQTTPPLPPSAQNQRAVTPPPPPAPQVTAKPPNPARRYCTNCGAPMPYDANFCPACGTAVFRP